MRATKLIAIVLLSLTPFLPAAKEMLGQTNPGKSPSKTTTTKTTTKAVAPTKPSTTKTATTKSAATTSQASAKTPARYRRPAQMQPSQQRYREIQQALADKGFFSGNVDGNWGPESVDALKRFQRDQKLADDGKIGSLSLIALGLGSPHGTMPPNPSANVPHTPAQ